MLVAPGLSLISPIMALGTPTARAITQAPNSAERDVLVQVNTLLTRFNALLVKLDADAGVTDTNYEATLAAGLRQIGNASATPVSA